MAPNEKLIIGKSNTFMEDKKYSTAFITKDVLNTIETPNDVNASPPSRFDSGTNLPRRRKSSRRHSKHYRSKRNGNDVKQHSCLPKLTTDKYYSPSESKSKEGDSAVHKQHGSHCIIGYYMERQQLVNLSSSEKRTFMGKTLHFSRPVNSSYWERVD